MGHVTIIAEIGSSPAPAWAFEPWCAAAAKAGADAVKVQLFKAEHFPEAEQASKRPLEFPRERLAEYVRTAHAFGLTAGASVFDLDAVALAAQWCDWLKLAAREQDNQDLIVATLNTDMPVYRSQDTSKLLPAVKFHGYVPLYALQEYPALMVHSLYKVFFWAMYCKSEQVTRWGWSSHTIGTLDCILASRLGASVIEKHLAIHPTDLEAGHSLSPSKFGRMVAAIRKGEKHG